MGFRTKEGYDPLTAKLVNDICSWLHGCLTSLHSFIWEY